ncbi:hypothetical protein [Sorangium sp. So ce176]|uniref:hypothetical protein n=1 Tax=Sorangium sp. So ce176 TaxID=3133286 RepID=UPI003F6111B3
MKFATWLIGAFIDAVFLACDMHNLALIIAAALSGGAVSWLALLWALVVVIHGAIALYGSWKSRPRLR